MKFDEYLEMDEATSPETRTLLRQSRALRKRASATKDPEQKKKIKLEIAKINLKLAQMASKPEPEKPGEKK